MTPSGKACSVCHLSSFQWPAFYGTFTLLFCKRGSNRRKKLMSRLMRHKFPELKPQKYDGTNVPQEPPRWRPKLAILLGEIRLFSLVSFLSFSLGVCRLNLPLKLELQGRYRNWFKSCSLDWFLSHLFPENSHIFRRELIGTTVSNVLRVGMFWTLFSARRLGATKVRNT